MGIKARTKPTPRIGEMQEETEAESRCEPYELVKNTRYRVDNMGMDTGWRDYQLENLQLVPPKKKPALPKFRVDKGRKMGPNAPTATDNLLPPAYSKSRTPRQGSGASVL